MKLSHNRVHFAKKVGITELLADVQSCTTSQQRLWIMLCKPIGARRISDALLRLRVTNKVTHQE